MTDSSLSKQFARGSGISQGERADADLRSSAPSAWSEGCRSLSKDETTRAGFVAGHLFAELQKAIEVVPTSSGSARALAKSLGIDPNITQRIKNAMHRGGQTVALLAYLPAAGSLRRFFKAVQRRAGGGFHAESALEAVVRFERLQRDIGVSHSRFAAMVGASVASSVTGAIPADPRKAEQSRRRMFNSAAELTGLSLDLHASVSILRPLQADPELIDLAAVSASIGLQVGPEAMPVLAGSALFETPEEAARVEPQFGDLARDFSSPSRLRTLVREFSSPSPPVLVIRREARSILQFIEPPPGLNGGKFDAVLGGRLSPLPSPGTCITLGARSRTPARLMTYTAFLHQDLAGRCRPAFGVYIPSQTALANPQQAWYDRLPSHGVFELLGTGAPLIHASEWPRMNDLVNFMFQQLDWDRREFVGYRLVVPYPCWGAVYNMMFDFTDSGGE